MNLADPLEVLTLADRYYAMPLAVMVRSLLENCDAGARLRIKIVDGGILPEDRVRLAASWCEVRPDAEWEFVAPVLPDAATLPVWGRVPALTYARMPLEAYYPDHAGRVLVLDSDLLVLRSVARLFAEDLSDAIAAACVDPYIPNMSAVDGLSDWRELGLDASTPYFNAGVLLADLPRWREEKVTERAMQYIHGAHRRLRQYDQDGLNAVLARQWKQLDSRWQVNPRVRHSLGDPVPHDPWIVHYSGRLKPWMFASREPADQLFFEYLDRTAWRGFRPPRGLRSVAYAMYDSPLRRLVYPLERRLSAWRRGLDLASR